MACGLAVCLLGQPRASVDAEREIATEMRAFYDDLEGGRWSALLDHFLPAKVTARWEPPEESVAWAQLSAPPVVSVNGSGCAPRMTMAVVGDWARVLARRCGTAVDEAWLLRVSARWKIVRLSLGGA